MPINYRAGLDQLARGDEVIAQGTAKIGAALGEKYAAQIGVMKEQRAMQQQNIQARQAEKQQMFDNVRQGAQLYLQGQQSQREAQRFKMDMAAEEQRQAELMKNRQIKTAQSAALNTQYADIVVPKEYENDPDLAAAYRSTQVTTRNAAEELKLKNEKTQADIAQSNAAIEQGKENIALSKRRTAIEERKLALEEKTAAFTQNVKPVLDKLNNLNMLSKDPKATYTNGLSKETVERGEKSYSTAKLAADTVAGTDAALARFGKLLGETPIQGKFSQDQYSRMAQKIKSLPSDSPEKFEIEMLATQIAYYDAKSFTGGGNISASEHGLLQRARGTNFAEYMTTLSPTEQNMFKSAVKSFFGDVFREGQFKAFAETQEISKAKNKDDVLREIKTTGGLYSVDKERRGDLLFSLLPAGQKEAIKNGGGYSKWVDRPFSEQLSDVFGDKAKGISVAEAEARDSTYVAVRSGKIDAHVDVAERQLSVMSKSGSEAERAAARQGLNMLNAYRTEPAVRDKTPNGYAGESTSSPNQYVGNGVARPMISAHNSLTVYRPINQTTMRNDDPASWLDLNLDPNKPPTMQVNRSTFK